MSDPTYYQIQILAALEEIHKELAWFRAREEAKDKIRDKADFEDRNHRLALHERQNRAAHRNHRKRPLIEQAAQKPLLEKSLSR